VDELKSVIYLKDKPIASVSASQGLQIEGNEAYVPQVLRFPDQVITRDDPEAFVANLYRELSGSYVRASKPLNTVEKLTKQPPRPGLVPQSGDPEHPVRWVRPQEQEEAKPKTGLTSEDMLNANDAAEEIADRLDDSLTDAQSDDIAFILTTFSDLKNPNNTVLRNSEGGLEAVATRRIEYTGGGQYSMYVDELATHPKNLAWAGHPDRMRGAGTRMLVQLAQEALQNKASSLQLYSRPSAVPFYEKIGFKKSDISRESAVHMVIQLGGLRELAAL
jgi:hypothetical protein